MAGMSSSTFVPSRTNTGYTSMDGERRVSFTISRMAAVRRSLLGLTIIITISPQKRKEWTVLKVIIALPAATANRLEGA